MPGKPKTVRMRLRGSLDRGLRWEVLLGKRWIGPHDSYWTGSEVDRARGAKRSGTAWARREYGPDVVIEWE